MGKRKPSTMVSFFGLMLLALGPNLIAGEKSEPPPWDMECQPLWLASDCEEKNYDLPPTTDNGRYRGKEADQKNERDTYYSIAYGGGVNFNGDDLKYRRGFRSLYEMVSVPVALAVHSISNERTLAGVTAGYVYSIGLFPFGLAEFIVEGGIASLTHFGKLFGFVDGKIKPAAIQFLGSARINTRWSLSSKYQFLAGIGFLINGDPKYGRANSKGYFSYHAGLSRRF